MIGIRVFNFTKEVADSKLDCWRMTYNLVALSGESLSRSCVVEAAVNSLEV